MSKIRLILIQALLILLSSGCKSQTTELNYVDVKLNNTFKDTCLIIKDALGDTLSFYRNIEIIENSFTDTLNIGFSIVQPLKTGDLLILQSDTSKEMALYNDPKYIDYLWKTNHPELKTKYLCIYRYSNGSLNIDKNQMLTIRLTIKK